MQNALELACQHDRAAIAKRLLADPRALIVRPGAFHLGLDALSRACAAGLLDVVELMLAHPRSVRWITPQMGTEALVGAIRSDSIAVVSRLLASRLVEPSLKQQIVLETACFAGWLPLVNLLLAHPRVDVKTSGGIVIKTAAAHGHAAVVERLLREPRVDPAASSSAALRSAAERGHVAVVASLLRDGRADPAAEQQHAIVAAAQNGHDLVVRLLLQDARAYPCARTCRAVSLAAGNGHTAALQALLEDDRVWARVRHSSAVELPTPTRGWSGALAPLALQVLLRQSVVAGSTGSGMLNSFKRHGLTPAPVDFALLCRWAWARRRAAVLGRWVALTADD